MPELPEVEIVRQILEKELLGENILSVSVFDPFVVLIQGRRQKTKQFSEDYLNKRLSGKKVKNVLRKGKLLFLELDSGVYLTFHLKMTGSIIVARRKPKRGKHLRITIKFKEKYLQFYDVRRFGYVEVCTEEDLKKKLSKMGPDALYELDSSEELYKMLSRSHLSVKKFLLDQSKIAGIGNAYADEILYEARILPFREASKISRDEAKRLFLAIKRKLQEGIEKGGLTIRNYRNAYGKEGSFQNHLLVYGKAGNPCISCGSTIVKSSIGGRSTHFCSRCQK